MKKKPVKMPAPTPFDAEIRALERKLKPLKQKAHFHRRSLAQQAKMNDPEYRRKYLHAMNSKEAIAKRSAATAKRCAEAAEKQRRSERMKAQWADPKMREKMQARLLEYFAARRLNRALNTPWRHKDDAGERVGASE